MFSSVKEILNRARRVYLNDPNSTQFADEVLLDYVRTAYDFLQSKFENNDLSVKRKTYLRKIIAGGTRIDLLPSDFAWPLSVDERLYGSSDEFFPLVQSLNEITGGRPTDSIIYWAFVGDNVTLAAATADREVRLTYLSTFPEIVNILDNIRGNALPYLAAKVAALAHTFVTQNLTLADQANRIAEQELDDLVRRYVKASQSIPSSPLPYVNTGW